MLEEKESFWKKKGFYLSLCTAMVCLLAVGTVYYKMNYGKNNNEGNLFAESQTEAPDTAMQDGNNAAVNNKTDRKINTSDDNKSLKDDKQIENKQVVADTGKKTD